MFVISLWKRMFLATVYTGSASWVKRRSGMDCPL